jgi:hypothetical protein
MKFLNNLKIGIKLTGTMIILSQIIAVVAIFSYINMNPSRMG